MNESNRALYGAPVHFYAYGSRYGMRNKITSKNVYHICNMVCRLMTTRRFRKYKKNFG